MDGWIAYQMTKCSRKTNKHGRERPNEGGVSPHHRVGRETLTHEVVSFKQTP